MILSSLAEERRVELVVNEAGRALLLYAGRLQYAYDWVQYDEIEKTLFLMTDEGTVQPLGMPLYPPFLRSLKKTRELIMMNVDSAGGFGDCKRIPLVGMVEDCV